MSPTQTTTTVDAKGNCEVSTPHDRCRIRERRNTAHYNKDETHEKNNGAGAAHSSTSNRSVKSRIFTLNAGSLLLIALAAGAFAQQVTERRATSAEAAAAVVAHGETL